MKRKIIVIIIVGIVVVVPIILMSNLGIIRNDSSEISLPIIKDIGDTLETLTNDEGLVSVAITPKNISSNATYWDFDVSLSTHSVDIGEDLAQVAVLSSENGKEYKPIEWQGDPPGGHHRNGVLVFGEIVPFPEYIVLLISGVGDVEERKFEWAVRP